MHLGKCDIECTHCMVGGYGGWTLVDKYGVLGIIHSLWFQFLMDRIKKQLHAALLVKMS